MRFSVYARIGWILPAYTVRSIVTMSLTNATGPRYSPTPSVLATPGGARDLGPAVGVQLYSIQRLLGSEHPCRGLLRSPVSARGWEGCEPHAEAAGDPRPGGNIGSASQGR